MKLILQLTPEQESGQSLAVVDSDGFNAISV